MLRHLQRPRSNPKPQLQFSSFRNSWRSKRRFNRSKYCHSQFKFKFKNLWVLDSLAISTLNIIYNPSLTTGNWTRFKAIWDLWARGRKVTWSFSNHYQKCKFTKIKRDKMILKQVRDSCNLGLGTSHKIQGLEWFQVQQDSLNSTENSLKALELTVRRRI